MSQQPIIDQQDPFAWVDDIPHLQNPYCMEADLGFTRHLKERISAKEMHIDHLHEKLEYNRRFRRVWRFTAILALAALAIAVYHGWGVANCAPL